MRLVILQITVLFIINSTTVFSQCHIDDWTALKALYQSTNGDDWDDNTGWEQVKEENPTSSCDLDLLEGVDLNEYSGRVVNIRLSNNNLSGSLPNELALLTELEILSMPFNLITGNIPNSIGSCGKLRRFGFDFNQLTGPIPKEIGNLSNLVWFDLLDNRVSGEIPNELGNLINIDRIQLSGNQLTGEIPIELATMGFRYVLRLDANQLTGCIPPEFGDAFFDWMTLNLNDNNLSGCYDANLLKMCDAFDGNYGFADPFSLNNLEATFYDFCFEGKGICDTIMGCRPNGVSPLVGSFNCD